MLEGKRAYICSPLSDRQKKQIGKQFLDLCDVLIICGRRISSGMEGEIRHAFASGKEVYWYDGVRKPFELEQIREWKEIEYSVQIPENHISE